MSCHYILVRFSQNCSVLLVAALWGNFSNLSPTCVQLLTPQLYFLVPAAAKVENGGEKPAVMLVMTCVLTAVQTY